MKETREDPRIVAGLRRQLALRQMMLDGGAVGVGWKVGFGSPSAMDLMQIIAPLTGFMTDVTLIDSGATVETAGWDGGFVEFEVAVYLGEDLPPGLSEDAARAAISAVGPAIELANVDRPVGPEFVEEILAGDIFHKGVILGERDATRAGLDISGLSARVLIDGREYAATANLEANTGSCPRAVKTVADALGAQGERLRAGDVIITGAVIPPVPTAEGKVYTFFLDPFPPISVVVETAPVDQASLRGSS